MTTAARRHPDTGDAVSAPWWRQAVVYQIYPRSFADANGDGLGDLPGILSRVDYLVALGVDAVWLSPFYPSKLADGGYDVSDYRNVDPRLGTLEDFDALVERLHAHGIRVVVDIVPNHTSDEHPWFQEALRAGRGSAARARYIFREGSGAEVEDPPPTGCRRSGGLRGSGSRTGSGTSTTSRSSSRTSTGRTPRSAPTSCRRCASGPTGASTASASTSPTC